MGYFWTEKQVDTKLEEQMKKAFHYIWEEYKTLKKPGSLRLAAYIVATKRIIEGERLRRP
jgi:glutamate dehydrogenase